ncbi:MAG: hypothetical protein RI922_760, partial [Bacteroidota bacterium]
IIRNTIYEKYKTINTCDQTINLSQINAFFANEIDTVI